MTQYPVNLVVDGRPVLVVGGGPVAARKVDGLVACGAVVTVVAPTVVDAIRDRPGVAVEQRPYERGDVRGQWLVVTATNDPAVNQAVHDDAVAAGIWVNSADDPDRCTFTLPAVLRRGPLQVTVSTGGASPALSSWLRRRLEAELGPELAELTQRLALERARIHAEGGTTEGLDWDAVIERELSRLRAEALSSSALASGSEPA